LKEARLKWHLSLGLGKKIIVSTITEISACNAADIEFNFPLIKD
jgi:hypothetical protein